MQQEVILHDFPDGTSKQSFPTYIDEVSFPKEGRK